MTVEQTPVPSHNGANDRASNGRFRWRPDRQWEGYLFLIPSFIGFLIFVAIPVLISLLLSFLTSNYGSRFPGFGSRVSAYRSRFPGPGSRFTIYGLRIHYLHPPDVFPKKSEKDS